METIKHISEESFPSKEIERMLNDLRLVGPNKPVGYLPLSTITGICKTDVAKLTQDLEQKGLKTIIFNQQESNVGGGALYAYDENALHKLLDTNKNLLTNSGWPTEPELFIRNLKNHAERKTELFDLVADSFGDKTNLGRRDVA